MIDAPCYVYTPTLVTAAVVIHVPRFCPIIIGIAIPDVIGQVSDNACKIPTEADEL